MKEILVQDKLEEIKLWGLTYFDKWGSCNCEWCNLKRSQYTKDRLQLFMYHCMQKEEYEICNRILKEMDKRDKTV